MSSNAHTCYFCGGDYGAGRGLPDDLGTACGSCVHEIVGRAAQVEARRRRIVGEQETRRGDAHLRSLTSNEERRRDSERYVEWSLETGGVCKRCPAPVVYPNDICGRCAADGIPSGCIDCGQSVDDACRSDRCKRHNHDQGPAPKSTVRVAGIDGQKMLVRETWG